MLTLYSHQNRMKKSRLRRNLLTKPESSSINSLTQAHHSVSLSQYSGPGSNPISDQATSFSAWPVTESILSYVARSQEQASLKNYFNFERCIVLPEQHIWKISLFAPFLRDLIKDKLLIYHEVGKERRIRKPWTRQESNPRPHNFWSWDEFSTTVLVRTLSIS